MDAFKYTAEEIAAMKILLPAFERYGVFLETNSYNLDVQERYCDVRNDLRAAIWYHQRSDRP